jgi:hypothetical protein
MRRIEFQGEMMSYEGKPHEYLRQREPWGDGCEDLNVKTAIPDQNIDLPSGNHSILGEVKLLSAVLQDAIRCYVSNVHSKSATRHRQFMEAKNWFEGLRHPVGAFSFENLCAALDIEPQRLLERLRTLTSADLPLRRYQMRRHRALSRLRHPDGKRERRRARN